MKTSFCLMRNGARWIGPAASRCRGIMLAAIVAATTACSISNHAWRPMVPVTPEYTSGTQDEGEPEGGNGWKPETVTAYEGKLHPLAIDPAGFGLGAWGIDGSLDARALECGYDADRRMFSADAAMIASEPNACTHDGEGNSRLADEELPAADRYSLAAIEFDDFGEFWNPHQLRWAGARLKFIGRGASKAPGDDPRVILLGYVHGWRHNASEHSRDFREFRSLIRNLAARGDACELFDHGADLASSELYTDVLRSITPEQRGALRGAPQSPCHVFGFYIGWRGDSTGVTQLPPMPDNRLGEGRGNPFLKAVRGVAWGVQSLSPLGRKASARRVASVPATRALLELGAILAELESTRRQAFFRSRLGDRALDGICRQAAAESTLKEVLNAWSKHCASRSVVVGHSFGARVLENAVAQGLIGRQDLARRMQVDDRARLVGELLEDRKLRARRRELASDDIDGLLVLLADAKSALDRQLTETNSELAIVASEAQMLDREQSRARTQKSALRSAVKAALDQSLARSRYHEIHNIECMHLQRHGPLKADQNRPALGGTTYGCSPFEVHAAEAELLDRASVNTLLTAYHATYEKCRTGALVNDLRYDACVSAIAAFPSILDAASSPCRASDRHADLAGLCGLFVAVEASMVPLAKAARELGAIRLAEERTATKQEKTAKELRKLRRTSFDIADRLREYEQKLETARSQLALGDEDARWTREMVLNLILAMHSDVISLTRPPFDTVVLVNPATEALTASMLREGLDDWRGLRKRLLGEDVLQAPMLVSMTSRGDLATRCALPFTRVAERFASPAHRDDMFGLSQPPSWSEESRAESNWSLCVDALRENWLRRSPTGDSAQAEPGDDPVRERNRGKGRKQYVYLGKPAAAIRDLQSHSFEKVERPGNESRELFCFKPHCARASKRQATSPDARVGCAVEDVPAATVPEICYAKSSFSDRADPKQQAAQSLYESYLLPKDIVRSHGDVLDNPLLQALIIHQASQWAALPLCPTEEEELRRANVAGVTEARYCSLVEGIALEDLSPPVRIERAEVAVQ